MKKKYLSLSISLLLLVGSAHSQIVVDSLAINSYVQDVLLGNGVQATNITFIGCLNQIGYLQGGNAVNLGIDGGVILSTDHVRNVEVPSPNLWLGNYGCTGVSGDADLVSIANSVPPLIGQSFSVSSANDISVLEFDFVPTGDTLRFNYIFGSDEYLEWVNTGYNDIFAFFLSGPGITGPYASPGAFPGGSVNIAQLPNTNPALPVTISSVNDVLNSTFYIDNFNNENISIDGHTVVLEAWSPVQCGETYHIKLAIADGTDTALESIVVLEEGSFSSNAVVDVNLSINVGGPDADIIYEDCGEATLSFSRAAVSDLNVEDMVIVSWLGTANVGVDYASMPDTILFPIGVSTVTFNIDAFEDGITEGQEIVYLEILNLAACNGSGLVSNFEFFIGDEPDPLVVEGFDIEICQGASATLEPTITGGYGNFQYNWSTNEITPTIDVSPLNSTQYFLTVSDTCGMPSDDASFLVSILVLPPLTVSIDNGDFQLACNESVTVTATPGGGDGNYTYLWLDENGNNLWGWENTLWYGSWNGAGEINVELTDGCGFTATDVVNVTLNVPALIVDLPTTINAPCNQAFSVQAATSGGSAPYWYSWSFNNVADWNQWTDTYTNSGINSPGTISVTVGDNCGQSALYNVDVTIDSPPIDLTLIDVVTGNCNTIFNLIPTVSGGSGTFTYSWSEGGGSIGSSNSLNFNNDQNTVVNLTVTDACGAQANDAVNVEIINPEITVDLGADIFASCIDDTELTAQTSGGSGGIAYAWTLNGTVVETLPTYTIQSFETVTVSVSIEDVCGMTAEDDVVINIPNIPLTITTNADTTICVNGSALLWALAGGGEGGFNYQWPSLGINGNEAAVDAVPYTSQYTVNVTDICGRTISSTVDVIVEPVDASFNAIELSPNYFEFTALGGEFCDQCAYFWELGDGNTSQEASFDYNFDGLGAYTVSLLAVNPIGCTDIKYYTVTAPPSVYIPNSFTPNGDGINDVWAITANSVKEFEVMVFNRWGEMVFTTTNPQTPWMGDNQSAKSYFVPDGVYPFVVKIKGFNSEALERTGNITITR